MSNDQIRKLLGGYATNTLTETERRALFEAAVEDQDLFDALQHEQALKELLADPASRVQIHQALEKPVAVHWWSRWWAWAGAAGAVAATVLIVTVTGSHPRPVERQYASVQEAKPAAPQPSEKLESDSKALPPSRAPLVAREERGSGRRHAVRARASGLQNERKDENRSTNLSSSTAPENAPAAPPPPAPFTDQVQADTRTQVPNAVPSQGRSGDTQAQNQQVVGGAVNGLRDQEQGQANQKQLGGAVRGALYKSELPPLRFTLLRRDESGGYQPLSPDGGLKNGDAVRLMVAPPTSGYLSLSRQDAAGQWTRVYPETGPGLNVSANSTYTIPAAPISVAAADQSLRITLIPASMIGLTSTGQLKAKTVPLKKESAPNPPLFVDFVIGPKKNP